MILGILQARASSKRLPGKVLKPICGKPIIELQIERLLRARRLDELMLATSTEASDDPISELALKLKLPCFRGGLEDVLERFYFAALTRLPETIVRFTADCPLADPELIDEIIAFHQDGGYDYSSNTIQPSYPDGLDAEVFNLLVRSH